MGKIEEGLKKVNADIDAAADKGLQNAQRPQFTGLAILIGIVSVVALVAWLIIH